MMDTTTVDSVLRIAIWVGKTAAMWVFMLFLRNAVQELLGTHKRDHERVGR
jgi:hypothetical protein